MCRTQIQCRRAVMIATVMVQDSWMKEMVKDGQSQACCKTWITIIISSLSPCKSGIIQQQDEHRSDPT